MSPTGQSPSGGHSNTYSTTVTTSNKGKESNKRIKNHNGTRRKNRPVNISQTNFIDEVPSFGAVLGTVNEQCSTKK